MTISEYKLSSPRINGSIVFTYHQNVLFSIVFKLKSPLNALQVEKLFPSIPYSEEVLRSTMQIAGVVVEEITPTKKEPVTAQEKIALFCRYYSRFILTPDKEPIKYRPSKADGGMIKHVDVTDKLLTVYFTSNKILFKGHWSIGNYVKFFNQLCVEAFGEKQNNRFPNHFDKDLVQKLSGPDYSAYFQHLRSLGMVPKMDRFNKIIDFEYGNAKK